MNPERPDNEEWNGRKSTNIPTHGNFPKWLEDISQKVVESHINTTIQKPLPLPPQSVNEMKKVQNYYNSNEIPTIISHLEELDLETAQAQSYFTPESASAKYGRRSSLTSQFYASNTPKNVTTKSDYIVPKLDMKSLHCDTHQIDLEKSWKSLDDFNQSHKGRLDSAKNFEELEATNFDDYNNYALSPISSDDTELISSIYSPSIFEPIVPNRSRSEMSNYLPFYVYNNIKHITESTNRESLLSINKSKSTENISLAIRNPYNFFPEHQQQNYDPIFGKKLNDYQLKLDKENRLRDEIISELLSENEIITGKLKQNNLDEDFINFTTTHQKLYNTNSKYKSHQQRKSVAEIFIIPELPRGKTLVIDILTTWGDKYYVGLNGIEIFDKNGQIVHAKKITAIPPDVNILPECNNDPRIVTNLLDGINRTQDDMHIWLAPFEVGCSHIITIEFHLLTTIAMIRIWNYNKSRIHSYRGVRDIVMFLDEIPIFKGEIAKACGGILGGVEAFGDTILFTTNDEILENISKNDSSYSYLTSEPGTPTTVERPPTATLASNIRPITGPVNNESNTVYEQNSPPTEQILLGANQIDLILLTNWGHSNRIGLTGIEIVQGTDTVMNLNRNCISCNIKSKYLTNLINGENITIDERNMWRVPFTNNQEDILMITIGLEKFSYISGIRIWNYNSSLETSYIGVRSLKILLDGKPVENPLNQNEIFLLRRASGNLHYDFVQDLKFTDDTQINDYNQSITSSINYLNRHEFDETLPEGFVFQIIIFSSWGDQYYCGLNAIELYNENGTKILLEEQNVCAYPESVNSLPNVSEDIRTPDKLIDGINSDHSGSHSWLAPIIPKHLNRIYIVMDQPITVSFIKLWNYSKSPNRGIKEFGILVDDLLVYNGTLEKYSSHKNSKYQTIIFTENEAIINQEYDTLIRNSAFPHNVILLDDTLRTTTGGSLPEADPALRPFTSVSSFNRGFTSQSH